MADVEGEDGTWIHGNLTEFVRRGLTEQDAGSRDRYAPTTRESSVFMRVSIDRGSSSLPAARRA